MTADHNDAADFSAYSDCWKSEYGTRPRHEVSRDEMIAYLEDYNARIDQLREQWAKEDADFAEMVAADEAKWAAERAERDARAWEALEPTDWLSAKLVGDRHP